MALRQFTYLFLPSGKAAGEILQRVLVRLAKDSKLEVHLDTDEGNACDLPNATRVELFK